MSRRFLAVVAAVLCGLTSTAARSSAIPTDAVRHHATSHSLSRRTGEPSRAATAPARRALHRIKERSTLKARACRVLASARHSSPPSLVGGNVRRVARLFDRSCVADDAAVDDGAAQTSSFSLDPGELSTRATAGELPLLDHRVVTLVATAVGHDEFMNPRTDYDTVYVTVNTTPSPTVSFEPTNLEHQDPALCAASCFAVTAAVSAVPYYTLDAPRSVTLVYSSDRAAPRPFVYADVVPRGSTMPAEYQLKAVVNGVAKRFANGDTLLRFTGSVDQVRLAGQLDTVTLTTGAYPMQLVVTTKFAGQPDYTAAYNTKLVVINDATSPVARGWAIAGVQHLYPDGDSALVVDGSGAAAYFRKAASGACPFVSPRGDFTCLRLITGGGWVRAYPDSSKVTFNAAGQMTRVADRLGMGSNFAYDPEGRLHFISDPVGTQQGGGAANITLSYGANGLAQIVEPLVGGAANAQGRTTYVTVGATHNLTAFKDPDGDSTRFTYDGSNRLATMTDRRGATYTYTYAASGKLAQAQLPAVALDAGNGTTQTPTTPLTLGYAAWQSVGVPTSSTSASPASPVKVADVKATTTDAGGHVTTYTVDRWGQAATVTDPFGRTTITYRRSGTGIFADSVRDWKGNVDRYSHSGPYLATSKTAGQPQTAYTYTRGVLTKIERPGQLTEEHFLDTPLPRVMWTRLGGLASLTTSYTYDALNRVKSVTDPKQHVTTYDYDATFGNTERVTVPGGRFTAKVFDRFGRDSISRASGQPDRTTLYDAANRPTQLHDGVNGTPTVLGYDKQLRTTLTDAKGQAYRSAFNALGQDTLDTDPGGRTTSYRYDRDGHLTSRTNRRGQVLSFTYDSLGRPITKRGTNTQLDSTYYSSDGRRITSVSIGSGSDTVSRTDTYLATDGWTDSVATTLGGKRFSVRYVRDTLNRLVRVKVDSSAGITFVTRRYGYSGLKATVDSVFLDGQYVTVRRDSELNPVLRELNGQARVTDEYTAIHSPSHRSVYLGASGSDVVWRSDKYDYDSLGRVQGYATEGGVGARFTYDSLGRLSSRLPYSVASCASTADTTRGYSCAPTDGTYGTPVTYRYDAVGNRSEVSDTLYGAGNRLLRFNGKTYEYDADGNLVRRFTTATGRDTVIYEWSSDGRLTRVLAGPLDMRYAYDGAGQPVRRTRNGAVDRYFLWADGQILAELNSSATQRIAEYVYRRTDEPLAVITGATIPALTRFHVLDALGNVTAVLNGAAADQQMSYDDWGASTSASGDSRLRWKGLLWEGDSTQLYFMRARWYDPTVGRFLSEDPSGQAGGINAYQFAGSNPIGGRDPTGLSDEIDCDDPFIWNSVCDYDWMYNSANREEAERELGKLQSQLNMQTGDRYLDDPRFRPILERLASTGRANARFQGYINESAGVCTIAFCTRNYGSLAQGDYGDITRNVILMWHTHPNEGMPVPGRPGHIYDYGPSSDDVQIQSRRSVDAYIFTPNWIYRLHPTGQYEAFARFLP